MNLVFALSALLLSTSAHADSFISARCQVALLKVTTEALDKEFTRTASKFDYIGEVSFNYGMEGEPRAVFFGTKKNESEHRCLVQVYTKVNGSNPETGCPNYEYSRVDSNCE